MLKRIFTLSGLGALVLIFILASLASASSPTLIPSAAGESYAPDRIVVRFAPGVSASTRAAIHRTNGAVVIGEIPQISVQVLRVPTNRVPEMVAAYSRNPNVLYAEPDYIAYAIEEPDPYFWKQWGLNNDGQEYKEGLSGTVDADIDAPEAWDITTGDPTVYIAILDTGIDQDHEDLGKIVADANFTDSGTEDDLYGHGTHVAGIAAAETNNTKGVAGTGYNSSLMNVKVLNDQGSGYYSWIANGITWATNNGAHVINMSLGGYRRSRTLEDAVNYAWSEGVVLAAAAGNDGTSRKLYPAAYTNCIAVAATDDDDQRVNEPGWWASNYGDWVDVAAPGLYIYSTFPNHTYVIDKLPNYDYGSGTSMATPHVAGLAGLLFGQNPGRTNSQVRNLIETTADAIPGTGTYWIHGRINACNAVGGSCAYGADQPPSVSITNPSDGDTVSGTVTVMADASDDNGVAQVEFFVDGSSIGVDTDGSNGWSTSWDTTATDGNGDALYPDGGYTITATATDTAARTASDSIGVTVDNVNDPPLASFTYTCSGLACDFDGSGSSDPDGTIVSYDWDFGDLTDGSDVTVSHTYAAAGTYTVTLTVTDDDIATDTDTQDVTVSEAAATMHVGDLDGEGIKLARGNWKALVTITVHDASHSPVASAMVFGTFTQNGTFVGTSSCTTDGNGTCTVDSGDSLSKQGKATFTVDDVTHSSLGYDETANHDADGDSDGTSITLSK